MLVREILVYLRNRQATSATHVENHASMPIAENIAVIHERIAAAARRAGRRSEEINLMAVTKTHSPAENHVKPTPPALRLFGENRVQEFRRERRAAAERIWPEPNGT